ncbi:MAG: hypothetical protein E7388_02165 [Ruminococcaceae bacterium]|nr:hypothetical protein [Oscillospiraceae bacterium]
MKKTVFKKSVAIVLAVAMLVSALPLSIFATDIETASEAFVSETHDVFKRTTSTIAPGVTQDICYAYAKDGNQMVYYVAVADVTRDDVIVQTSYKEQYQNQSFGMAKLTEQIAFADKYYTDAANEHFVSEYYKVVAGVNASFYNMTTGQPSGITYLDGVQIGESSSYTQFFAILKDGTAVIDYTKNLANYEGNIDQAVAGSQMLVWDGADITQNASGSYNTDRHSRTCVGVTADGKVVLMSLDGRQVPFSCGGTMHELAQIMLEAGCVAAINLDGGGSTTFAARQEGEDNVTIVNRPSDGSERSISSGLIIASLAAPSDVFERASLSVESDYVTPGSVVTVSAKGVSPAGTAADIPENAGWQLEDSSMGTIENGVFTSNGTAGDAVVQMVVDNKVVGEATIHVVVPDSIQFDSEKITVPYGKTVTLGITAKYGLNEVVIKPSDITFTVSNTAAGTINGFDFTGCEENEAVTSTTVKAVLNFNEELYAETEITLGKGSEVVYDFEDGKDAGIYFKDGNYNYIPAEGSVNVVDKNTGKVHSGNNALALNLDFSNSLESGYQRNSLFFGEDILLKNATSLGMWIYIPDEAVGLWARWVVFPITGYNEDGTPVYGSSITGQTIDGKIDGKTGYVSTFQESGWHYISIDVSGYPDAAVKSTSQALQFYISDRDGIETFGYDFSDYSSINSKFVFYIDDVTIDYSSAVDDRDAPIFSSVVYADEAMSDAVELNGQTTASNRLSFTASVADANNSNATGIDVNSVNAYIDGNLVESTYSSGKIIIDNTELADGLHTIKFSVCDKLGNYASVIREVNVKAESDIPTVKVVAKDSSLDRILFGSLYYVDVVATDIEKVQSVSTVLDLNNISVWELDHMEVAEGFTATYSIVEDENIATITITRTGANDSTGEGVLVSMPIRTWQWGYTVMNYGANAGKTITYAQWKTMKEFWPIDVSVEIDCGTVNFVDGTVGTFSGARVQVDTEMWADDADMISTAEGLAYYNSWNGGHEHRPEYGGTPTSLADKPATCTEAGYTGRTFCEECNSVVDWGTEVAATGHTYSVVEGVLKCDCGELFNGVYEDGLTYVDGVLAAGWIEDSYYVDGAKLTGIQYVDEYYYDFGEDGISKGKYTGLFYDETVGAYKYAKIGVLATKWVDIEGEWYYFNEDYTAASGNLTGKQTGSTGTYNFEYTFVDGKLQSGVWVDTGSGIRYYYGPSYYKATNVSTVQWFYVDGVRYGADPNGYRYEGVCALLEANEKIPTAYVFAEDGAFVEVFTGTGLAKNYAGRLFYYVNGEVNHAGLVYVDGYYYYIDSSYRAVTEGRYVSEEWANGLLPAGTYEFGEDGKMLESSIPSLNLTEDATLSISNDVLYGVKAGQTIDELKAMFDDNVNIIFSSDVIGTGTTISLVYGGITVDTITVMVTGDTSGDGEITAKDYMLIKAHIKSSRLSGVNLEAADIDGDGVIKAADYMKVKRHITGAFDIYA